MPRRDVTSSRSFGKRLADLADTDPDGRALVSISPSGDEQVLTWRELDDRAAAIASALAERGVDREHLVAIRLPHGPWHVATAYAAWRLGATVLPLNDRAPTPELAHILATAGEYRPVALVGVPVAGHAPVVAADELEVLEPAAFEAVAEAPRPAHVIASGGTTGRPKLIVADAPGEIDDDAIADAHPLAAMGLRSGQRHLIVTPLHHTSGFTWLHHALVSGDGVVLLERFDADLVLETIVGHRINHTIFVPSIMQRLAAHPRIDDADLSSIEALWHGGSVCPPWLKRRWIDLVGGEHLFESFGASENIGSTMIRGDEWLQHPGSVGRPAACDLRIVDEEGHELPPGEVGEIFTRRHDTDGTPFRYIGGGTARTTDDGFASVGDLGWVDEDGYLHVADRRTDMIITGGANVFAAEVESVLSGHPDVADVAVIGLPDERWGRRVHAIVEPRATDAPPVPDDLDRWSRERLSAYKVPKTYEFTSSLPRNEVGKLLHAELVEERSQPEPAIDGAS